MKLHAHLKPLLAAAGASLLTATATGAPISGADIIAQFNPGQSLSQQAWGNVQCYGLIVPSQSVPEQGINGTTLPLGGTLRFGRAADPIDSQRPALRFTLLANDPLTAGSYRCETAFSPGATGLPRGKPFWHAFAVHIPDWRNTTDEQQLAQWHAGDTSGMQPIYSLLVRDGQMRLVLRYSTEANPTASSVRTIVLWSSANWAPNSWYTVVTKAMVSTDPAASPYISTWINGAQVVNYRGPVGFNQPQALPYVKHGIYHWVNLNAWDTRAPQRTVHFRRAALVGDSKGIYSPDDLALYVNAP